MQNEIIYKILLQNLVTLIEKYKLVDKNALVYFYEKDGLFSKDCLLFLEDITTEFTEEKFYEFSPVFMGNIGLIKLKEIIKKIKIIDIPNKIKRDILESFRLNSIQTI